MEQVWTNTLREALPSISIHVTSLIPPPIFSISEDVTNYSPFCGQG